MTLFQHSNHVTGGLGQTPSIEHPRYLHVLWRHTPQTVSQLAFILEEKLIQYPAVRCVSIFKENIGPLSHEERDQKAQGMMRMTNENSEDDWQGFKQYRAFTYPGNPSVMQEDQLVDYFRGLRRERPDLRFKIAFIDLPHGGQDGKLYKAAEAALQNLENVFSAPPDALVSFRDDGVSGRLQDLLFKLVGNHFNTLIVSDDVRENTMRQQLAEAIPAIDASVLNVVLTGAMHWPVSSGSSDVDTVHISFSHKASQIVPPNLHKSLNWSCSQQLLYKLRSGGDLTDDDCKMQLMETGLQVLLRQYLSARPLPAERAALAELVDTFAGLMVLSLARDDSTTIFDNAIKFAVCSENASIALGSSLAHIFRHSKFFELYSADSLNLRGRHLFEEIFERLVK